MFKGLVEACSEEGVTLIYPTSNKEGPGLKIDLNVISSIYISTGREAYFSLNRLNADMLVLTTPDLDVLEIKRSKNVKHYCHLSHATSSIGGYKAFSLDYYDSVIIVFANLNMVHLGCGQFLGLKRAILNFFEN